MQKKSSYLKGMALAILFSFVCTECVWAVPGGIAIAPSRETPAFLRIEIPKELASIEEVYEAPPQIDPRMILHIQDLHGNYEAQSKIKKLLNYLHETYDFQLLFVEGASDQLNPDLVRVFPNEEQNKKFVELLGKEGELSGPEMFVADTRGDIEAIGIEDVELYRKNYDAFKAVHGQSETTEQFLSRAEQHIERLSSRFLSKDLLRLLKEWRKFEKGQRDFLPYVKRLSQEAKRFIGLDLESLFAQVEWPQTTRLLVLQSMEKDLDADQAEREKQLLLEFLISQRVSDSVIRGIEKLGDREITMTSLAADESQLEKLPRYLLERLIEEAGPKGFFFHDYPQFSLLAGYLILQSELDSKNLFDEINKIFEKVLSALAIEEREKNLLELHRDQDLLRKLLSLELTRKEWERANYRKEWIRPDVIVKRIYGIINHSDQTEDVPVSPKASKDVMPTFRTALKFYDYARERDQAFYEKIDESMTAKNSEKAILVTGGFHTDGLMDIFREEQVNYGVLMPKIGGEINTGNYIQNMLEERNTMFDLATISDPVMLQSLVLGIAQGIQNPLNEEKKFLELFSSVAEAPSRELLVDIFNTFNSSAHADDRGIKLLLGPNGDRIYIQITGEYPEIADAQLTDADGVWQGRNQDGRLGYITIPIVERKRKPAAQRFGLESHIEIVFQGPAGGTTLDSTTNYNIPSDGATFGIAASETRANVNQALAEFTALAEAGTVDLVAVADNLRLIFEPELNNAIAPPVDEITDVLSRNGFQSPDQADFGGFIVYDEPSVQSLHGLLIQTDEYSAAIEQQSSDDTLLITQVDDATELERVSQELLNDENIQQIRQALDTADDAIEQIDLPILITAINILNRLNRKLSEIFVDDPKYGITNAELGRLRSAALSEKSRRTQSEFDALFEGLGAAVPRVIDRIVSRILQEDSSEKRDELRERFLMYARSSEKSATVLDNGGTENDIREQLNTNPVLVVILNSGVKPGRYKDLSLSVQQQLTSKRIKDVVAQGEYLGRPSIDPDDVRNKWGEDFPELSSETLANHTTHGRSINNGVGLMLRNQRNRFRILLDESKGGGTIRVYVATTEEPRGSSYYTSAHYVDFYYSPFYQRVYAIPSPSLLFTSDTISQTSSNNVLSPGIQLMTGVQLMMGSEPNRERALRNAKEKKHKFDPDSIAYQPFNYATRGIGVSGAHLVAGYDPSLNNLYIYNVGTNGSFIQVENSTAEIVYPFAKSETRVPELLAAVDPASPVGWGFVAATTAAAYWYLLRPTKRTKTANARKSRLNQLAATLKDPTKHPDLREADPVLLNLGWFDNRRLSDITTTITNVVLSSYAGYQESRRSKVFGHSAETIADANAYNAAKDGLAALLDVFVGQAADRQNHSTFHDNLSRVVEATEAGPLYKVVVEGRLKTIRGNPSVKDGSLVGKYVESKLRSETRTPGSGQEGVRQDVLTTQTYVSTLISATAFPGFPNGTQLRAREGENNAVVVSIQVPNNVVENVLTAVRVNQIIGISTAVTRTSALDGYTSTPVSVSPEPATIEYTFQLSPPAQSETRTIPNPSRVFTVSRVEELTRRVSELVPRLGIDWFVIDLDDKDKASGEPQLLSEDDPARTIRLALERKLNTAKTTLEQFLQSQSLRLVPVRMSSRDDIDDEDSSAGDSFVGNLVLYIQTVAQTSLSKVMDPKKSETRLVKPEATVIETADQRIETGNLDRDFERRFGQSVDRNRLKSSLARRRGSEGVSQTNRALLGNFTQETPDATQKISDLETRRRRDTRQPQVATTRVRPELAAELKLLSEEYEAARLDNYGGVADKVNTITMKVAAIFTRGLISLAISPNAQAAVLEPFAVLVTLNPRNEELSEMESRARNNFGIEIRNNIVAGTIIVASYLPTNQEVESDLKLLELQEGQHLAYVVGVPLDKVKETEAQAEEFLKLAEERDLKDRFFIIVTFDDLRNVTKVTQRVANSTVHARMRRMTPLTIGQNMVTVYNGIFQGLATKGTVPGTPVTSDILRAEHLAARTFAAMRFSQTADSALLNEKAARLVNQELDVRIILPRDNYFYVNNDELGEVASILVAITIGEFVKTQA